MAVFLAMFLKIIHKPFLNRTEKLHTELLFSEKRSRATTVFCHSVSCLAQFHNVHSSGLGSPMWFS